MILVDVDFWKIRSQTNSHMNFVMYCSIERTFELKMLFQHLKQIEFFKTEDRDPSWEFCHLFYIFRLLWSFGS